MMIAFCLCFFFFFQAEDGIRDLTVTGVKTCALPICRWERGGRGGRGERGGTASLLLFRGSAETRGTFPLVRSRSRQGGQRSDRRHVQIGRASCRGREERAEWKGVGEGEGREGWWGVE